MSEIVGFDIKPMEDTKLVTFLEYGLKPYLEQLEEVGAGAAKEHQLEMAIAKMKGEWSLMKFELISYRDTVSNFHLISIHLRSFIHLVNVCKICYISFTETTCVI